MANSPSLMSGLQLFFCDKFPGDTGAVDGGSTAPGPESPDLEIDMAGFKPNFAGHGCVTLGGS